MGVPSQEEVGFSCLLWMPGEGRAEVQWVWYLWGSFVISEVSWKGGQEKV